jgi:hypothetical protein
LQISTARATLIEKRSGFAALGGIFNIFPPMFFPAEIFLTA